MPADSIALRAIDAGACQKFSEFVQLVDLVEEQQPRSVLEIGTLSGGTLKAWCECADPEATIVSVDLPGGRWGGGYSMETAARLEGYAGLGQSLHLIRDDSHREGTRKMVGAFAPFDFAFIDGDHTYEGVKQDFDDYSPLVRQGGLIAFHDVLPHPNVPDCDVDRLWAELREDFEVEEFLSPEETHPEWGQWGGIGVIRKRGSQ